MDQYSSDRDMDARVAGDRVGPPSALFFIPQDAGMKFPRSLGNWQKFPQFFLFGQAVALGGARYGALPCRGGFHTLS